MKDERNEKARRTCIKCEMCSTGDKEVFHSLKKSTEWTPEEKKDDNEINSR